jgi:serine/threonine-protein kinase
MKTCPHCTTGYPDSLAKCPTHDVLLNEIRDLKPGMVIHKTYRIVRKIGKGGMGTVYLAEHIHMGEQRALKFLSQELSHDQALVSRFLREVRTLRQVHSPNVVECGDLEAAEDDSLFFSMEFVDGPDLRDSINHAPKPFDVQLALTITRGIADGLGAAHAKGMVHRDIKPENILMGRDGDDLVPKIADFGIVATKENSSVYTKTGGTLLTMAYAAPEQWRGTSAAELDGRTDLYALGGVLFEMLTGETVFHAENYEGWMFQHQQQQPVAPSRIRPELAHWRGLDGMVLQLLAKCRDQRPRDDSSLLSLLAEIRYAPPVEPRWSEPARDPATDDDRPASRSGPLGLFASVSARPKPDSAHRRDHAPLSLFSSAPSEAPSISVEPPLREEDDLPHRHKAARGPIKLFDEEETVPSRHVNSNDPLRLFGGFEASVDDEGEPAGTSTGSLRKLLERLPLGVVFLALALESIPVVLAVGLLSARPGGPSTLTLLAVDVPAAALVWWLKRIDRYYVFPIVLLVAAVLVALLPYHP